MALFGRGKGSRRSEKKAAEQAREQWVAAHRGVEVYVEPKTAVTGLSILLVAHDGEFTRSLIASPEAAKAFARERSLPVYDATIVGYPQRMRDYSRRQKILAERAERDRLGR